MAWVVLWGARYADVLEYLGTRGPRELAFVFRGRDLWRRRVLHRSFAKLGRALLLRALFAGIGNALVDWLASGEAFAGSVPMRD